VNAFTALVLVLAPSVDQPALADISKAAPELKKAFNDATGSVRIVLIVSPG
jgi:hypothetical protein